MKGIATQITYIYEFTVGDSLYVGKTINVPVRQSAHRRRLGVPVVLTVVGSVGIGESWRDAERAQIALRLSQGVNLMNQRSGGGGLATVSDDTRSRLSKAKIGNKNGSGKRSQETCDKISKAKKGSTVSEEHRRKISESLRGRKKSPDVHAKMWATRRAKAG